jgi:release factor glutamine methyltransferase
MMSHESIVLEQVILTICNEKQHSINSGIPMKISPSSCTEQQWLELLQNLYPSGEIKAMRRLWLDLASGSSERPISAQDGHHRSWQRLLQGEPIQYVLGKAFFMGSELSVASGVLIPRPETEELVEWVLTDPLAKNFTPNPSPAGMADFLDLGSGSGCIALALALHLDSIKVIALDCEDRALQITRSNAVNWDVSERLQTCKADFMSPEWQAPHARFWISNPPYIAREEAFALDKHVIDFEPSVALFAPGGQPVEVYRTLISAFFASEVAECFWMELNPRYAVDIVGLVDRVWAKDIPGPDRQEFGDSNNDCEWTLRRDMQGQWRMLRIRRRNQACTRTA